MGPVATAFLGFVGDAREVLLACVVLGHAPKIAECQMRLIKAFSLAASSLLGSTGDSLNHDPQSP